MNRQSESKIILITRATRLAEMVVRHNTVSQARFYIEHQGADFSDYLREDQVYRTALSEVQSALSGIGRVQVVDRTFLPNFVFGPDDTVVVLGQDGLVANTLKYLDGQHVLGVNPDPERWDGRLLPFTVRELAKVMPEALAGKRPTRAVSMAKASLNNGQILHAVNDLFIGQKTHTSARYVIRVGDSRETQSSSGIIVSTGLGSTGWLKSLLTGAAAITQSVSSPRTGEAGRNGRIELDSKSEFSWDADYLCFTVREPFPSRTTGASVVFGRVTSETPLVLESRMPENGVIFSDGIEKDYLEFNSGTQAVITVAEKKGTLVN